LARSWLRHALNVKRGNAFSQLDSEITSQLDLLLKFYNLARDADILDRLQAREYAVEAEVERQVAERKALGEAVDADALEKDSEVVRGVAIASSVSDAEFQEELTREMREGFAQHGLKLDKIIVMMANLSATGIGNAEPDRSSQMSLYAYDRKPDAPPGQKDKLAARLGKGSFGVTYRMRKVAGIDARLYAVKMIESEELDGAGLEKEARLLSMIEHENTLRFYDAFWHDTDDGRLRHRHGTSHRRLPRREDRRRAAAARGCSADAAGRLGTCVHAHAQPAAPRPQASQRDARLDGPRKDYRLWARVRLFSLPLLAHQDQGGHRRLHVARKGHWQAVRAGG